MNKQRNSLIGIGAGLALALSSCSAGSEGTPAAAAVTYNTSSDLQYGGPGAVLKGGASAPCGNGIDSEGMTSLPLDSPLDTGPRFMGMIENNKPSNVTFGIVVEFIGRAAVEIVTSNDKPGTSVTIDPYVAPYSKQYSDTAGHPVLVKAYIDSETLAPTVSLGCITKANM